MQQPALFHDSIYDALTADVSASGGIKHVAHVMWPTLDSDTANARLRNGLNANHAQKLAPDEVQTIKRLARDAGSFATVTYESIDLRYDVKWISAEQAKADLQKDIAVGLAELNRKMDRLGMLR